MSKNKYARPGVERYNPRRAYMPKVLAGDNIAHLPSGASYEIRPEGWRRIKAKEPTK